VREYLARQRGRYVAAPRAERGRLLDEIAAVTGYHRKAIIRVLGPGRPPVRGGRAVGRPRRYGPGVAAAAEVLWEAAGQIGAKRLQPFVSELLERLTSCGELAVAASTAGLLRQISTATLERLLAPARHTVARRGRATTQPGSWLKQQIPIRTFAEWNDAQPGFLEVDLVAHCGHRGEGFFLHTLCAVDIATGWVECAPIWGKGHVRVNAGLHEIRGRLPVPLRGLDSDNVLSARGWSRAGTQHSSGGSGSRDSVRQQRTQPTQRSSASEKDPAAHSEHRVRARAGLALTALNTA
jgi:hypothetical protein